MAFYARISLNVFRFLQNFTNRRNSPNSNGTIVKNVKYPILMKDNTINNRIANNIKSRISTETNVVKFISQHLFLSENAVYKRIKGITPFTLQEAAILSNELGISIDALVEVGENNFSFSSIAMGGTVLNPVSYLHNLAKDSTKLDLETAHIKYASNEFPILQYFGFPRLNYFKFYLWSWTNWNRGEINQNKICFERSMQKMQEFHYLAGEIYNLYLTIPSTEFICLNSLHNTIQQIKYFSQIGNFETQSEAWELCKEISIFIDHLEDMAKSGRKFIRGKENDGPSSSFRLFNNEIIQSNNVCIISSDRYNKLFLTLDNPNTLEIDNSKSIQYVERWFDTMKKYAEPLGKESEKTRLIFFSRLRKSIDHLKYFLESQ